MRPIVSFRFYCYSGVADGVGVQYGIWRVSAALLFLSVAPAACDTVEEKRPNMPTETHASKMTVDEVFIMTSGR